MFERDIKVADVRSVIENGEILESYPEDHPYPSRLVLGMTATGPLHVVVADNSEAGETIVITAYRPDPGLWDEFFRRRMKP